MYPPDKELVVKAKQGDKQAFTMLFDKYKVRITSYLHGFVGDHAEAQDLTIETFLKIYQKLDLYKEEGRFSSWLYTVARNVAKNKLRQRRYRKEVSLDKSIQKADDVTLKDVIEDNRERPDYKARSHELKDVVFKIISGLDKKYKDVLLLCDVEGMSYEEVAKALNCKRLTVGTRLKRARAMLYKLLRKYGYEFKGGAR